MNRTQAETAVVGASLVVGGIYMYRRLIEGSLPAASGEDRNAFAKALGAGPVPATGRFVTGWGVTFVVLSLIVQAAPDFGGALAILIGTSDILGNGTALATDVNSRLTATSSASAPYGGGDTAGGIPVLTSGESTAAYDKRLNAYLLAHPRGRGTVKPPASNPLTRNPFTGAPNPLIP